MIKPNKGCLSRTWQRAKELHRTTEHNEFIYSCYGERIGEIFKLNEGAARGRRIPKNV